MEAALHQQHLEDTPAEHSRVVQELRCELDRCGAHGVLQRARLEYLEAILTREAPQHSRVGDLERELEREREEGVRQRARLAELEDLLAEQSQEDGRHRDRSMGALELELERLRRQAPLLEGASAEGGGPQQAPPQQAPPQPAPPQQPLERQARQEASVCQLDEPQLRELLQLELAQRARLQEPDGSAEQRLLSQEAAQQARAEELALELERRSAKDAAQHARTEELERALEQALRREEAQQARAARLEDRLHESSGPRLLRCEEQLAELAQELVDTRGMHHWQRARHREHVADLERDLAEARQGRAGGGAGGGLVERALGAEVAEARAELERRRQGQLRQLRRAEELQRAGLQRGLAAQAHVDLFEGLLRDLEASLPREARGPSPAVPAAAAPGPGAQRAAAVVEATAPAVLAAASAPRAVALVEARRLVHEPIGRGAPPLQAAPAALALGAPRRHAASAAAPPAARPAPPVRRLAAASPPVPLG